jgi:hypothetical protein
MRDSRLDTGSDYVLYWNIAGAFTQYQLGPAGVFASCTP